MTIQSLNTDLHSAICLALGLQGLRSDTPLALHEPTFGEVENNAVQTCLSDGWPSSAGPDVAAFENELSQRLDAAHVVACVNGTAALHIALHLANVRPDSEVILPAISFVGTANAALYCNAQLSFLDVSDQDYGLCPNALRAYLQRYAKRYQGQTINRETGAKISAIMVVHCFGYACQIEEISQIAQEFDIALVEDAAEALGSSLNGRALGCLGDFGVLSFNGNKIITTGAGGAILLKSEELAERARHLTTTAKSAHRWRFHHDSLGYNYRMPGLNAALGLGQLTKLDGYLRQKEALHAAYKHAIADLDGVKLLENNAGGTSNHWLNTISVPAWNLEMRNQFLDRMHDHNLLLRPVWDLLPTLPHLGGHDPLHWPVANRLFETSVNLPSSPFLGPQSA